MSKDPIGEHGGVNLYGFVRNNPNNRIDRLGLCCGSFAIISIKDVDVPIKQQRGAGFKETLDGFKVLYKPCDECACPKNKVHMVQAIKSDGGTGKFAHFDGGLPTATEDGGVRFPSYDGWRGPDDYSFLDGPNNADKLYGETMFSLEVCAVCEGDKGKGDKILGCVTFTFGDVARVPVVTGGAPLTPAQLKQYGNAGKHGGEYGSGVMKGCSEPGTLWNMALKRKTQK